MSHEPDIIIDVDLNAAVEALPVEDRLDALELLENAIQADREMSDEPNATLPVLAAYLRGMIP